MNIFKSRNNVIEYTVNKASNAGIYITVQNGEVLVNAPWYVTSNQIQQIVEQKRKWILEKIKEYEIKKEKQKEIQKQSIQILGNNYKMKVIYKSINIPEVNLEKDNVIIILPTKYKKIDITEILNLIINKLYTKIAEEEIEKAMEKARILLGFAPEDYKIQKIENTLSKCENKVITVNPEIVLLNRRTIEYIIIHEYCHLKYKTHSKKYIELIKKYEKNYKEFDEKLKKYKY